VLAECRDQAARWLEEKKPGPRSRLAATLIVVLIVAFWLAALIFVSWLAWRWAESWIAL
jgi:hypothetical protein